MNIWILPSISSLALLQPPSPSQPRLSASPHLFPILVSPLLLVVLFRYFAR
jgi:hypothetical protein